MSTTCLGVRTDERGNSATVQQDPVLPLEETCRKLWERVDGFLNTTYDERSEDAVDEAEKKRRKRLRDVQAQTRASLDIIGEALRQYSLDELSLSYNGGKDCLVLLILYLAALYRHWHPPRPSPTTDTPPQEQQQPPSTPFPTSLNTVYITPPQPFASVDAFIDVSARTYHLDLAVHPYPMKSAFETYLSSQLSTAKRKISAIFVGTRRTDPHGAQLTPFAPTSADWPSFMRIHPVLDWHYAEIWAFIREVEVPYCTTYDEGYTSLGGRGDTFRNPRLKVEGREGEYRPAFELEGDDEERLGRDGRGG